MKAHVYAANGTTPLGIIEGTPVCGVHFCDQCGDCLSCDPGPCYGTEKAEDSPEPQHLWVLYFYEFDQWTPELQQAWRDMQAKPKKESMRVENLRIDITAYTDHHVIHKSGENVIRFTVKDPDEKEFDICTFEEPNSSPGSRWAAVRVKVGMPFRSSATDELIWTTPVNIEWRLISVRNSG